MKNFQYLFAAWLAVWAGFFFYHISLAKRLKRLRDEVEFLKRRFHEH